MFNFQNAIELCAASRIPNPNSPINMFIGGGGGTFTHCSDQLPSVCSPSMAWQFWVRNDTMYTLTYLLQYISTSACPYWQRPSFRSPSILTSTTNLTFWFNTKNAPSKYTVLSNYIKHIKSLVSPVSKNHHLVHIIISYQLCFYLKLTERKPSVQLSQFET